MSQQTSGDGQRTRSATEEYRASVKNLIETEVGNIIDEEIKKAAQELIDEQRRAIREAVNEHKAIVREVVEEEKRSIHERIDELRESIIRLGSL